MRKDAVMRCGGYMHVSSSSSSASSGAGTGTCGDVTELQVAHVEDCTQENTLMRGGVVREVAHVEDYDLWLRLVGLLPSPSSGAATTREAGEGEGGGGGRDGGECYEIYNTGDVLLLLRKHAHNVSARNAQVHAKAERPKRLNPKTRNPRP